MDQIRDFRKALPALQMKTIFDIGANVGRTVRALRDAYRKTDIYAFEPVQGTFALLQEAVGRDPQIKCFNMAFGDVKTKLRMDATPGSVKNRISDQAEGLEVDVRRGDEFCAEQGIDRINFLKIDTEGYDLKVCQGFSSMLQAGQIDLLQVESGLSPKNKLHVPLQAFKEYLEPIGYSLFRIYDQAGWPVARRCDAVFVSSLIADSSRRLPREQASWL